MHPDNRTVPVARAAGSIRWVLKHATATLGVALLIGSALQAPALVQGQAAAATSGCQLAQVALCETFDAPATNTSGSRSGDLNPVLWGVSRVTSNDNPTQGTDYGWNASHLNKCGTTVLVGTPRDVEICNGTLVESVSDQGSVTMLAMYPKQPFDFAGRTGRVVMDISNDTQGSHMAWPEIIITDQPVPAPTEDAAGVGDFARNSFGVALGQDCNNGIFDGTGTGNSFGISSVWTTSNYGFQLQNYTSTGCALKSGGPTSPLNHVELRVSSNHFELWATDAGSSTLKELGYGDFQMPLTRGLVWMEDVHYNACKEPGNQCDHTFAWDNFGFDGPILPRDLTFDVLDAQQGPAGGSLGYLVPAGGKLNLQIPNVTSSAISNASAALLVLNYYAREQLSLTYSLNGHAAHTTAWPFGNQTLDKSKTLAISVPLSELVSGNNALTLSSSQTSFGGLSVANIDLIMVGAGGGGSVAAQPTNTPTTVPPTPVPNAATPTPVPPTPVPNVPSPTPSTQPQPSTVIIGNKSIASSIDSNDTGQAEAFPYAANVSGSATKLGIYLDATSSASRVVVGLYANSSANQPGSLLTQAVIQNPVAGWNTVAVPSVNLTAGQPYWIAVLAPTGSSGGIQFRDQANGALSVTSTQTTLSSLPSTWQTGATWPSGNASLYLSN